MAHTSAHELRPEDRSGADDLVSPIDAAAFKSRCLQIMDRVNESGAEVTITKHGRPVAKLVPVGTRTAQSSILGACKESLIIVDDDDLVPSTADEWVEWEAQIDRGLDASGLA